METEATAKLGREAFLPDDREEAHLLPRSPRVQLKSLASLRAGLVAGGHAQFKQVSTASGYASCSAGPVHFGLGAAKAVNEIEIRWPSGTIQTLKNVPADQMLRVKEPT